MAITAKQYAQALYDSLREVTEKDHDTVIQNLTSLLRQNNDLDKYEEIITHYEALEQKGLETTEAVVTTAGPNRIDHESLEALNVLADKKVKVTQVVDESIIGGVVIRVDDTLIDASLKTKLDQLNQTLKGN